MTDTVKEDGFVQATSGEASSSERSPDPIALAKELAEVLWESEGCDLDNEGIQNMLVRYGIIRYRKPTAAELSDPDWWGHEYEMEPDYEGVGEWTPAFKQLRRCQGDREVKPEGDAGNLNQPTSLKD